MRSTFPYHDRLSSKQFIRRTLMFVLCLVVPGSFAVAQEKTTAATAAASTGDPLSGTAKRFYGGMKGMLLKSAEKMPEEHYNFKPTDAVRSYGQIIAHVADSHYGFCSIVRGEKRPAVDIERTKTTKADLVAALKESFSYCDAAFNGLTDASGIQIAKFMGKDAPKLGVFMAYLGHSGLHYGNLVTYMRMKNIVPPTSELEPAPSK